MSLVHKIALTLVKNIGSRQAKKLLKAFGDPEAIFLARRDDLLKVEGIGEKIAASIISTNALSKAESQLQFIVKHQIEVLFYTDENYPKRLRQCYDAPILLYFKGKADFNQRKVVSIVGTRNATPYGKALCKALIASLIPYKVLIVSGLAYGVDIAAHEESLTVNLPTVAVLGHGLDRIYPAMHKATARKMISNGGLLSEFLPGTAPDRENFPKRNRIIAGLSDVTVVIEASISGGALITAEIANSYSRDVYAFPGRIDDKYSEGCNFLIKTNRAGLINHPRDLIYYMGWEEEPEVRPQVQTQLALNLNKTEQQLVDLLQHQSLTIDELSLKLNQPQSKLAMALLSLEMQGILVTLPGKLYKTS